MSFKFNDSIISVFNCHLEAGEGKLSGLYVITQRDCTVYNVYKTVVSPIETIVDSTKTQIFSFYQEI